MKLDWYSYWYSYSCYSVHIAVVAAPVAVAYKAVASDPAVAAVDTMQCFHNDAVYDTDSSAAVVAVVVAAVAAAAAVGFDYIASAAVDTAGNFVGLTSWVESAAAAAEDIPN